MTDPKRNVLVLVLEQGFADELRRELADRPEPVRHVRVVAPRRVGRLDWLTTAEDDSRQEAGRVARETAWSLDDGSIADDRSLVESEVGEYDPVLAVEDALRTFPADEILVVGSDGVEHGLEPSLRRFGVPVDRVPGEAAAEAPGPVSRLGNEVKGGRSGATPVVLFAGVNLVLIAVGAVVAVILVLAIWVF
jgi:hypothetical protein